MGGAAHLASRGIEGMIPTVPVGNGLNVNCAAASNSNVNDAHGNGNGNGAISTDKLAGMVAAAAVCGIALGYICVPDGWCWWSP
mmetsp:Transcript_21030/g.24199  ORF Transcript_21030/g.24199 Transcript_21030/m.24199 type:complete len:84 (-) Transcript_21030:384-635(-)